MKDIKIEEIEDESPYCSLCTSCGENLCCHYTNCVFTAIDNNKECLYPETYKREVLLRDYFFDEAFNKAGNNKELIDFLDIVYDAADKRVEEYFKLL